MKEFYLGLILYLILYKRNKISKKSILNKPSIYYYKKLIYICSEKL